MRDSSLLDMEKAKPPKGGDAKSPAAELYGVLGSGIAHVEPLSAGAARVEDFHGLDTT